MQHISLTYLAKSEKLKKLQALMSKHWAVLLDSANPSGDAANIKYNRYDIFSYAPAIKLTYQYQQTQIDYAKHINQAKIPPLDLKDPLDCMRQLIKIINFSAQQFDFSLPFYGGWLGYIGYDYGRNLQQLSNVIDDDLHIPQICMGLYEWALITDHQNKTSRLVNFSLPADDWQTIQNDFSDLISNKITKHPPLNFSLTSKWQSNISQQDYAQAFNKIHDYIQNGDCYQVNFSQRFTADFNGSSIKAYQLLSQANQAPFSAYLNYPEFQVLSLSPERFIESHNSQVTTQPIKGTRARASDPQEDARQIEELINSVKDRAENLMIVDLLRNDLSRTAAKASVKVSELFAHYSFSSVHHLISTIHSQLSAEYDNYDLLETTLPGGSITGAPKIRAMQIIEELEQSRRSVYCGIIAYIDGKNNMDSNICIRTLLAKDQQLYCWSGGGLVADSNLPAEYQETFDKLTKILPVLSP